MSPSKIPQKISLLFIPFSYSSSHLDIPRNISLNRFPHIFPISILFLMSPFVIRFFFSISKDGKETCMIQMKDLLNVSSKRLLFTEKLQSARVV